MLIDVLVDPFDSPWPAVRDAALAAEGLGYGGVWTWDHLAGEVHGAGRVLECWTTLTAIAGVTERVTIGPLVANVANHPPGVLAVMAATLQEVSGGRLVLGLGAGAGPDSGYRTEQTALGQPVHGDAHRRAEVADTIAVCRQVWSGHTEAMELSHRRLAPGAGFLVPAPEPPIVVAGFGPKMAALAGTHADGLNTVLTVADIGPLIEVADAARLRAGRTGPFEISGQGRLEPRMLEAAHPRLDRLIVLHRPADGDGPLERFAREAGLAGA